MMSGKWSIFLFIPVQVIGSICRRLRPGCWRIFFVTEPQQIFLFLSLPYGLIIGSVGQQLVESQGSLDRPLE